MTESAAARVAGFSFLFYIAVGISSMAGVLRGLDPRVATYSQNACAIILALTLFAITRREQPVVAALGMVCRLLEGTLGAVLVLTGLRVAHPTLVGATFFAAGSVLFCWLFLRAGTVPRALAWTGVVASALLVVGLPLQLAGLLPAPLTTLMWMPMLAFEIPAGLWLLIKGIPPQSQPVTNRSGSLPYA